MIIAKPPEYAIDVVFCLDVTAGATCLLEQFQDQWEALVEGIRTTIENNKGPVRTIRVRVITFRDFLADREPIYETEFFELPRNRDDFLTRIQSFEAKGGGDTPENAYEALALALKSEWTQADCFRRHVIFMITDAPALELQEILRRDCPQYPYGMPKDLEELTSWYHQGTGTLDLRGRRLILFAPEDDTWEIISQTWDYCLHICLKNNEEFVTHIDRIGEFVCANM